MSESRNERLAFDYHEMLKIQNRPYLSWIAAKGELPYAEEYLLNVKLRTYVLTACSDRYLVGTADQCMIKITLWDSYPHVAPSVRMLRIPPVFHPAWYSKGAYCPAKPWRPDDSLKEYVKRVLGTLMYAPSLTETDAPANYKALEWYLKNRDNTALFPSDTVELTENDPAETAALMRAASFDEIIDSWEIR